MGKHPERNTIIATHTADLSERWSRKVRNTLTSPEHQLVFPHSQLSKDSTSVSRWATSEGGELLAAGVGGAILGFRADLGIIDDPIGGFEQAQSITQLAKVHDWYETDFVTRLKPGAKTVLICQRLARNDLAGYMIDRNIKNPTRRQRILKIPMLNERGERLWPEWYTEQMVADFRRDDFKWRTLFMQEPPSDTGSWADSNDFQFAPSPTTGDYYICADLALSVGTGDYTVIIAICHDTTTGRVHIVDMYRQRVDPDQSSDQLVSMCQTYHPREVWVDDDNAAKVWMQLVATRARSTNTVVNWHPLKMMGQNKETRAASLRGMFKRKLVHFDPSKSWTNIIVNECLQFPNAIGSGVDDCVDSLSLMGRRLTILQTQSIVSVPTPTLTIQSMTLDKLYEDRPRRGSRMS
jgi:predicted phage terminase large subunit-like protein